MNNIDIDKMVYGSLEATFATKSGKIVAWNRAAEQLFGINLDQAVDRYCDEIVDGINGAKPVCSLDCAVQRSARQHCPICDYQMQIPTLQGRQWVNMRVLIVSLGGEELPYLIHTAQLVG